MFGLPRWVSEVLMMFLFPLVLTVVVVCHQLEWVVCQLPPDGFSACYAVLHISFLVNILAPHDSSSLSVGLVDVWPPSMGF